MFDFDTLAQLLDSTTTGNVIQAGSFCLPFVQWIVESRAAKKQLDIDHYLEWLRRQNHADLAAGIQENRQLLELTTQLIEDVKLSVLEAVAQHEANSERRKQEMLDAITAVPSPKLEAHLREPVRVSETNHTDGTVKYRTQVQLVNKSQSQATVEWAKACWRRGDEEFKTNMDHGRSRLSLIAGGGVGCLFLETKSVKAAGPPVELVYVELHLGQDRPGTNHRYLPGPELTLVEVDTSA